MINPLAVARFVYRAIVNAALPQTTSDFEALPPRKKKITKPTDAMTRSDIEKLIDERIAAKAPVDPTAATEPAPVNNEPAAGKVKIEK